MIGIIEVLAVEQQQSNDTATDCCIRKIEYRAEENEMFSTDKRHPCGPGCINDGEIEHILWEPDSEQSKRSLQFSGEMQSTEKMIFHRM